MNHLIHLHADGLEVMIVGGFWLSDRAWAAIEPLLPSNQPGARRVDDRRVISGIVHVLRVGCRWQDCPSDYGPATTVYNRFNRWSHRGLWGRIFATLSARVELAGDPKGALPMIIVADMRPHFECEISHPSN